MAKSGVSTGLGNAAGGCSAPVIRLLMVDGLVGMTGSDSRPGFSGPDLVAETGDGSEVRPVFSSLVARTGSESRPGFSICEGLVGSVGFSAAIGGGTFAGGWDAGR